MIPYWSTSVRPYAEEVTNKCIYFPSLFLMAMVADKCRMPVPSTRNFRNFKVLNYFDHWPTRPLP